MPNWDVMRGAPAPCPCRTAAVGQSPVAVRALAPGRVPAAVAGGMSTPRSTLGAGEEGWQVTRPFAPNTGERRDESPAIPPPRRRAWAVGATTCLTSSGARCAAGGERRTGLDPSSGTGPPESQRARNPSAEQSRRADREERKI